VRKRLLQQLWIIELNAENFLGPIVYFWRHSNSLLTSRLRKRR